MIEEAIERIIHDGQKVGASPREIAAIIASLCNEQLAAAEEQLAEITRKYQALDGGWGDMEQACDNLTEVLTVKDEQLAEMREALEQLIEFETDTSPIRDWGVVDRARQTLSAAPKRGRVIWEGNGRVREEAGYHEDERSSYHYIAYYVEPLKITDFDSFLVGTDLDDECKWLHHDLLVTVTVREAE